MFQPKFTVTSKILSDIGKIEGARALIENAPLIPSFDRQFKKDALIRAVHHSTHIEGNLMPYTQVKQVIDGNGEETAARARDIQEIINYRKVMDFIDKTALGRMEKESGSSLAESDLLSIHKLVIDKIGKPDEAGTYRRVQVAIRNSVTGQITFMPPKAERVGGAVRDFFSWSSGETAVTLHPVLRAGIVHAEITRIHPFTEGNGRTSRALATLSLYLDGYDIKRFFCLDEYYDEDSQSYYKAIQTYQKESDLLTPFLEYFVEGLAVEMGRVRDRVMKMSRDTKVRKAAGQLALTERQEKIVDYLQDYSRLTNNDFPKIFPDLSEDSVLRDLKELIKKKVIVKKGQTKAAHYEIRG